VPRFPRRGPGVLDRRSALTAVDGLEAMAEQLDQAARWLDGVEEVRAASYLLSAQRSILAACYVG
jgi:hypothetical protein